VRPFLDTDVISSARRIDAPVESGWDVSRFLDATARMSARLDRPSPSQGFDPGSSLLQLLNFADMVSASVGPRPWEPLQFPVVSSMGRGKGGRTAV
jgi:hypothetical protein